MQCSKIRITQASMEDPFRSMVDNFKCQYTRLWLEWINILRQWDRICSKCKCSRDIITIRCLRVSKKCISITNNSRPLQSSTTWPRWAELWSTQKISKSSTNLAVAFNLTCLLMQHKLARSSVEICVEKTQTCSKEPLVRYLLRMLTWKTATSSLSAMEITQGWSEMHLRRVVGGLRSNQFTLCSTSSGTQLVMVSNLHV